MKVFFLFEMRLGFGIFWCNKEFRFVFLFWGYMKGMWNGVNFGKFWEELSVMTSVLFDFLKSLFLKINIKYCYGLFILIVFYIKK